MIITFQDWQCRVVRGRYPNGRPAIQLFDVETDVPIATATINLPEIPLDDEENEVFIKDYSENEGMLQTLMAAGIVSAPISHHHINDYGTIVPLCELLYGENE